MQPPRPRSETITDYLLGAATLFWGVRLLRRRRMPRVQLYWGSGFLALAGAAFAGGTYHALAATPDAAPRRQLWNATLLLIGASGGLLVSGAFSGPLRPWEENTHWVYAGLALTTAAVLLREARVSLGPRFTRNDLFHILVLAAFYFFYRDAEMTDEACATSRAAR